MNSNYFNELRDLLEKLPGIGPRQANRFIWALADFDKVDRIRLSELLVSLGGHLTRCKECFRVYQRRAVGEGFKCSFCDDGSKRNKTLLMIVERDSDIITIEKSGVFDGLYHVLGDTIDPLGKSIIARERATALHSRIKNNLQKPSEIILAFSLTKSGEFTSGFIARVLEPLNIRITQLGKGISSGVELEYADDETLRKALENRK
jgi:recombination protein RecR